MNVGRPWRSSRPSGSRGRPGAVAGRVERASGRARAGSHRARWSSPRRPRSGLPGSGSSGRRASRHRAAWARIRRTAGRRPRRAPRVVLQVVPVWACSAMASVASRVSKPGKFPSSKPPSDCCWVFSQATAALPVARRRVGAIARRTRRRVNKMATVSATHAREHDERATWGCPPWPLSTRAVVCRPTGGSVWEHRWPGGQRQVAWLAECGGCRRAAHSCGSASVSHRLPPSPGRGPGTARNIRVARNRCREGTLGRRDDRHAIPGAPAPGLVRAASRHRDDRPARRGTRASGWSGRWRRRPASSSRRAPSTSRS